MNHSHLQPGLEARKEGTVSSTTTGTSTTRPKADLVYQTICDLSEIHRAANRARIAQVAGMSLTQVDDAIKKLKAEGRVMSIAPGLFEPVPVAPPDRAVTITQLPEGRIKLEVADGPVLELTHREARIVGRFLAGAAQELGGVDQTRHMAEQVATLTAQVARIAASLQTPSRS